MLSKIHTYFIYQVITFIFLLGISFLPTQSVFAQQPTAPVTSVTSVVKSINGNIVETEGDVSIDLSETDIDSLFGSVKISDIKPGAVIFADGQVITSQSSATHTFFKADDVTIQLTQEIKVSAPIQKVDSENKTITLLNKDISISSETELFQRKKRKLKPTSLPSLAIGNRVSVEMLLQDNGTLVAERVIEGLDPENIDPIVIGFIKNVNGGLIEFAGGFKVDISHILPFPAPIVDGVLAQANIPEMFAVTNQEPYLSFGFAISRKGILFIGAVEKVDLDKQTITLFGRELKVNPQTQFSGVRSLKDIKLNNVTTSLELQETSDGLVVLSVSQ